MIFLQKGKVSELVTRPGDADHVPEPGALALVSTPVVKSLVLGVGLVLEKASVERQVHVAVGGQVRTVTPFFVSFL